MGCCASSQSINEDDATIVPVLSSREKFFATYRHQDFSFRDPIMFYIAMNPSTPEVYQKMIQACKYFFAKNSVLVVPDFPYYDDNVWSLGETSFDLNEIACKFWITDDFSTSSSEYIEAVIPKLFRCDAKYLRVNDQTISFQDLSLLIPSAETIAFNRLIVKDENGSVFPFEKVFEAAVKVSFLALNHFTITSETLKELIKIPHFSTFCYVHAIRLTEDFDLDAFYGHMKKNQCTHFWLEFAASISDAYKIRLEEIVDEIIATETFDYKPVCIWFNGLDVEKRKEIDRIFNSHW